MWIEFMTGVAQRARSLMRTLINLLLFCLGTLGVVAMGHPSAALVWTLVYAILALGIAVHICGRVLTAARRQLQRL